MVSIQDVAERYGSAWSGGDVEEFLSIFTEDAKYRDEQQGALSQGHEELRKFYPHFAHAFSNLQVEVKNAFGCGGDGCFQSVVSGTLTGPYRGMAPTGKTFVLPLVTVITITDAALISSCTDYYDNLSFLRQIGRPLGEA